ncbi:MAG: tetratricopeptide repeat protein [Candidatus Hydrogenedentota bacterium]
MDYYYPRFWEFVDLVAVAATLCLVNYLIRERWKRRQNAVPTLFAAGLWLFACAVCLSTALAFYDTTPDARKFPILMWSLLILAVPVAYYGYGVVDSFAVRSIDKISPFNARIEEPSEFAAARRMALRGDINGAVARYRQYHDNQAIALFEAARLLKSVDRYAEAVVLLEEAKQRFSHDHDVWAEATYQLAKIHESNLHERDAAADLLREVATHAADTRYGQLAAADIARLSALEGSAPVPASNGGQPLPPDPFFVREDARTRFDREQKRAARKADQPVPASDPFYKSAGPGNQTDTPQNSPEQGGSGAHEA